MLSRLSALVATAAVIAACLVVVDRPVFAGDPTCTQPDPATGLCLVTVEVPAHPGQTDPADPDGPQDSGSAASCYWDPTKQGVSSPPAGPVPCTLDGAYWSNSFNCYIQAADPQPPAGDPMWQGHDPGDGAVYDCFQPQTGIAVTIWAASAPPGSGAGPSPREVAEIAIKQMNLSAIDIGIVPQPGPDSVGLVGMPVWMWVDHPNDHTFGPITASASAGGITVTATAKVFRITWDMGDGTQVVCRTAGTPYLPSYGRKDSPDCGHTYERSSADQPDQKFTVSATSDWVVTWAGAGQTGTIRLDGLIRSTQIAVGEAQVLVS